jgi:protein TonB
MRPDPFLLAASKLPLWGGSFVVVVALHVGGVLILQSDRTEGEAAGDQAVIIELNIDPTAPIEGQSEVTPGPRQVQTDQITRASLAQEQVREQVEKEQQATSVDVEIARAPDPELVLPDAPKTPDQTPQEQKREKETPKQAQQASEARPESAPNSAPKAAAIVTPHVTTTAGAPVEDSAALLNWQTGLIAHMKRFKRYPAEAVARRQHGTTVVRFTINRAGAVLSAEIVHPSGVEVLDQEALRLIARAAPLPAATTKVSGSHFTFRVPIHFPPQR